VGIKLILLSILATGVLWLGACVMPTSTPEETVTPSATLLEFGELVSENETAKWENELGRWKPAVAVIDGVEKALTSRYFKDNIYVNRGKQGEILLAFEWNEEGSQLSEVITSRLINKPLGIFEGDKTLLGENGRPIAPIIRAVIKDRGQIEGLSLKEATRLSQQLNAGR
jgi:preprotein translocase subunit SecD